MEEKSQSKQIENLTTRALDIKNTEGFEPFAIVPKDCQLEDVGHLRVRDTPERINEHPILQDANSFIRYWLRHRAENSVIFCSGGKSPCFTAVFDYHHSAANKNKPQWLKHKARFSFPKSLEWEIWTERNKKPFSQVEFSHFIEDNLLDIAGPEDDNIPNDAPSAAQMLEIALNFKAHKRANFESDIVLQNGQVQLMYKEEIRGSSQGQNTGKIDIPEIFHLGISPFLNAKTYKIDARLRYRISDSGELSMWYELIRTHKVIETAFNEIKADIEKNCETVAFEGEL